MTDFDCDVLVIGGGPGGYTAAFRAADLGKKVILVEKREKLGGVCLNVGCIPSKALLHVAEIVNSAREASSVGIEFSEPKIDIDKVRDFKNSVVDKLTCGLSCLADQRNVEVVYGSATFKSDNSVTIDDREISFENCIIAAGSSVAQIPGIPYDDERVWSSTEALNLAEIPERLLIIGGGIIGLEMATVYSALGSEVTIVEYMPQLVPVADKDLVMVLQKRIKENCEVFTKTKVVEVIAENDALTVKMEGKKAPESAQFDAVLVAVGRRPNGKTLGLENTSVNVDESGFINVDSQLCTNCSNIFAVGDIIGQPMLAHKAVHEGKVAAEVICGHDVAFNPSAIPSVAYTEPELAWVGLTEKEAKEQGIDFEKANFPWAASGRALASETSNGKTKTLFDKSTGKLIGVGIVGKNAGELISIASVAISAGMTGEEIAKTIFPHPTLGETIGFASEIFDGSITDIMNPKV